MSKFIPPTEDAIRSGLADRDFAEVGMKVTGTGIVAPPWPAPVRFAAWMCRVKLPVRHMRIVSVSADSAAVSYGLGESIFPTFNVNVPMPGDTAVPGSFNKPSQQSSSGTT
jgi:hypothetical protein